MYLGEFLRTLVLRTGKSITFSQSTVEAAGGFVLSMVRCDLIGESYFKYLVLLAILLMLIQLTILTLVLLYIALKYVVCYLEYPTLSYMDFL